MTPRSAGPGSWKRLASAGALALIIATAGRAAAAGLKTSEAGPLGSAQDLAVLALGMVGVDYEAGGATPLTGLDCSGLVRYVFQQVAGITLPRTAQEMARLGQSVAQAHLQAGDLVFFRTGRAPFSHVGIYLGEDRFVHAPSAGRAVEIVTLSARYWRERYSGARRVLVAAPETGSLTPATLTVR